MKKTLVLLAALLALGEAPAQDGKLPAPRKSGGMPLKEALARRATSRAFDPKPLSSQQLSDVLWAAIGINRPDGKRTAPSSRDRRELDVYVLEARGVSLYDPKEHRLVPVVAEDLRTVQSSQEFVRDAPVTLVYVADLARMSEGTATEKEATASFDTGFVSQNVYLWCASEGLATGVRSWVEREVLAKKMKLRPDQRIIAAQSIAYPAAPRPAAPKP
ncbi:MAG: SagB/ThcOx family dehydrogenase [Thermoanaerobaculia bacterium]